MVANANSSQDSGRRSAWAGLVAMHGYAHRVLTFPWKCCVLMWKRAGEVGEAESKEAQREKKPRMHSHLNPSQYCRF